MISINYRFYSRVILDHFGQDKEVVDMAEGYIAMMIPGLWPAYMFEVFKRHLQNQVCFTFVLPPFFL